MTRHPSRTPSRLAFGLARGLSPRLVGAYRVLAVLAAAAAWLGVHAAPSRADTPEETITWQGTYSYSVHQTGASVPYSHTETFSWEAQQVVGTTPAGREVGKPTLTDDGDWSTTTDCVVTGPNSLTCGSQEGTAACSMRSDGDTPEGPLVTRREIGRDTVLDAAIPLGQAPEDIAQTYTGNWCSDPDLFSCSDIGCTGTCASYTATSAQQLAWEAPWSVAARGRSSGFNKSYDVSQSFSIPCPGGGTEAMTRSIDAEISIASDTCPVGGALDVQTGSARAASGTPGCRAAVETLRWGGGAVPVVEDRANAPDQTITEVGGGSCASPSDEWVSCTPGASPSKDWPVLAQRGRPLAIDTLTIGNCIPCAVHHGTLIGKVSLSNNGKMQFKRSDVNLVPGQSTVTVHDLTSADHLPNHAGVQHVSITWTILRPHKRELRLGTTKLLVYVTLGPPPSDLGFKVSGHGVETIPDELTIVGLASEGAEGASSDQAALTGIWGLYSKSDRDGLHRLDLDPGSGSITTGEPLRFWYPNWSLIAQLAGTYAPEACPTNVLVLLQTGTGTCNSFADLLVAMLKVEGIGASVTAPNLLNGWASPHGAAFLLVGNWSWGSRPRRPFDPSFPYADSFTYSGPTVTPGSTTVSYFGAPAQNNPKPPGMWSTGSFLGYGLGADHALVKLDDGGKIYDPSYGTGPFANINAWSRASIVGWAYFAAPSGKRTDVNKCPSLGGCSLLARRAS